MSLPQPIAPPIVPPTSKCKVCDQPAPLNGVVDFNKNCEIFNNREPLPLSGVPIYYYRCRSCGFLFTTAFDHFTHDDFLKWIYNDDYLKVDPDYASVRPQRMALSVMNLLPNGQSLRILDYGAGTGGTAQALREKGYTSVECYDPFVPAFAQRPQGLFDFIVCFEVIEHLPDPRKTVADMVSMLKPNGVIFFSSVYLTKECETFPVAWWYVAPRNGHVSIFTESSMSTLAASLGCHSGSFDDMYHVLFKELPPYAKQWLAK